MMTAHSTRPSLTVSFYFFKIYVYIYFLAVLGLHCLLWAFCSCKEQGLLFIAVCVFLLLQSMGSSSFVWTQ